MSGIRYDFDSDSTSLVSASDKAAKAMGVAEKSAEKLTVSLNKLDTAQEKASKSTTKGAQSLNDLAKSLNNNQLISTAETVVSLFIQMGGSISQVAIVASSAIRPLALLSAALSPAVLVMASIPAVAAGVVFGFKSIADAAVGAKDELDEMGRAAEVPLSARQSMRDYEIATDNLTIAIDKLWISLGERAIPSVTRLTTSLGILASYSGKEHKDELFGALPLPDDPILDGLAEMSTSADEASTSLERLLTAISSGGSSEILGLLKDKLNALADAEIADATAAESAFQAHERAMDIALEEAQREEELKKAQLQRYDELIAARKRQEEEAKGAAKAQADAERRENEALMRDLLAANERILSESRAAAKEQEKIAKEAFDAEQKWRDSRMDSTLASMADGAAEMDAIFASTLSGWEDKVETWQEQQKKIASAFMGLAENAASAFGLVADAINEQLSSEVDALDELLDEGSSAIDDLEAKKEGASRANRERANEALEIELKNQKALEKERNQAATQAFNTGKQLAISQALIASALAVIQAFAQLGPIAGGIAASGIAALTSTQIGIIQAQQPPAKLHDGGRLHDGGADEFMFQGRTVRKGESAVVLNQRATETGAMERANALNRDTGGDAPRETRLVMADAGRVIGELVTREMGRSGSKLNTAFGSSSGQADPYGRGRR